MTVPNSPVVLVTGGARRIGATIAKALHEAGCRVVLHYRHSEQQAWELAQRLEAVRPGSVHLCQGELTDTSAPASLIDACINHFGQLDGLVNNASTYYDTPVKTATPAQWDELIDTNLRAPFFLAKHAAPHLAKAHGAIVNIVDIYAERPLPDHSIYSISKAGLFMATKALAQELGPDIRVNAIAPGNILWSTNPTQAETLAMVEERTALARQGTPEDIAKATVHLLLQATYCTGTVLPIDGGRLLYI